MIKTLLYKYLKEYLLSEAEDRKHFNDRIKDKIDGINEIEINGLPLNLTPNQKQWIIEEIKKELKIKLNRVVLKDFPTNPPNYPKKPAGIIRLGTIRVSLRGKNYDTIIKSNYIESKTGKLENRSGTSFTAYVYDNRLVTLILWGNESEQFLLNAHIKNSEKNGWQCAVRIPNIKPNPNINYSFTDSSENKGIIINLDKLPL